MRRVVLLWGILALLGLVDLAATWAGLALVDGARETNLLPALAFAHSVLTAAVLKVLSLVVVLFLALELSRGGYERATERVLAAWCVVLAVVNAVSLAQLAAAGVFA